MNKANVIKITLLSLNTEKVIFVFHFVTCQPYYGKLFIVLMLAKSWALSVQGSL